MPGSPPAPDRSALWATLSHMRIEEPGTGRRFEEALAEETGWSLDFAERVADEYCGFLYLAATAGFEVTPSQAVDQAWHLHLEWPHYREILCREIVGRDLEHRPATGDPEDEARCARQYEETLALYERVFGKPPPADIWPDPTAWDVDSETQAEWGSRRRSGRLKLIAAGVATVGAATLAAQAPPLASLVIACLLAGILLPLVVPNLGRKGRGNAGCGAGGCGSDSDGGSSCGSSCGGGCGGGCGGD